MDGPGAAEVGAALLEGLGGRGAFMSRTLHEGTMADALADAAAGRNPAAATRATMHALSVRGTRDWHSATDAQRMLALRCVHLALALAASDRAAVAPHELADCLDALGRAAPAMREAVEARLPPPPARTLLPPTLPTVLPFALPWRDGRNAWRMGRGLCTVRDAPEGSVALGATLATPAGTLQALLVDGAWHRPLFAPGSWFPVTLDDFAEAVADGRPWTDNPFVPWAVPGRVLAPLATVTLPGHQAQGNDARRVSHGEAEALSRAGVLRAIDGVVYRPSSEPVVSIAMPADRREPLPALAWVMDRMHSGTSNATLDPAGPRFEPVGILLVPPGGKAVRHPVSFSASRLGDAASVATTLSAAGLLAPGVPMSAPAAGNDPGACMAEASAILEALGTLDAVPLSAALRSAAPGTPDFADAVRDAVSSPTVASAGRRIPGDLALPLAAALAVAALEGLERETALREGAWADMGSFVP